jgi:hypothetical protein
MHDSSTQTKGGTMKNPYILLKDYEVCTECGDEADVIVLADENHAQDDPYHGAFAVCGVHFHAWEVGDYSPGIS